MIGGVLFLGGVLGLVAYTSFLFWEHKKGIRLFLNNRLEWDRKVSKVYRILVFGEIPHRLRVNAINYLRSAVHEGIHLLAALVKSIEQPLARTSTRLQKTRINGDGKIRTPSPFLKDISELGKRDGKNTENSV